MEKYHASIWDTPWPADIPREKTVITGAVHLPEEGVRRGVTSFYVLNGDLERNAAGELLYIEERYDPNTGGVSDVSVPVSALPEVLQEYISANKKIVSRFLRSQEAEILQGVRAGIPVKEYANPHLSAPSMASCREILSTWTLTDDAVLQHFRPVNLAYTGWEFVQLTSLPNEKFCILHDTITASELAEHDKQELLNFFGYDMTPEVFEAEFTAEADRLIAEMLFESQWEKNIISSDLSYSEAVFEIERITGLDLTPYKTKTEQHPTLDQQIAAAELKHNNVQEITAERFERSSER